MNKQNYSKTRLKERRVRKSNSRLSGIIQLAIKNQAWNKVAVRLSGPTRNFAAVNLFEIEAKAKEGGLIVVPGKVLSGGELKKKSTIAALGISAAAKEKLKPSKSEFMTIDEAIKKHPKAEGMVIVG